VYIVAKFYLDMSLYDAFAGLTDPRRPEGRRIRLEQLLALVVIANLCGHHGYRPVARFCQMHQQLLQQQFDLKHGVPSYVTFRTVLTQLPQQALIEGFNNWAKALGSLSAGDWLSGDGKVLGATLTHMQDASQDFQVMVSLWSHQSGLVHRLDTYANASGDERVSVRELLTHFQDKGLLVRLDAIHTQKNT
jgi:hypothetical protein